MLLDAHVLAGKVALIAGVGSGMGGSTARLLASMGADIAAIDLSEQPARQTLDEIAATGRRTHLESADLREKSATDRAVANIVEKLGGIDILVTVAGGMTLYQTWRPFDQWTMEEWDEMMTRNLRYVASLSMAVLPEIEKRGGSVVYISSISGTTSAPNHAVYGAAKAGLINFTRSLAVEYARRGIRVNSVAPGTIKTEAVSARLDDDRAASFDIVPMGHSGHPDNIAGAVAFFVSPWAAFVTGQTLLVDGGSSVIFPF